MVTSCQLAGFSRRLSASMRLWSRVAMAAQAAVRIRSSRSALSGLPALPLEPLDPLKTKPLDTCIH